MNYFFRKVVGKQISNNFPFEKSLLYKDAWNDCYGEDNRGFISALLNTVIFPFATQIIETVWEIDLLCGTSICSYNEHCTCAKIVLPPRSQ